VPFGNVRLAAPGGDFAHARKQPEAIVGVMAARQRLLQGVVAGCELSAVGLGEAATTSVENAFAQRQQGPAFLLRGGVVRLDEKDRRPPGVRLRELRIERQGRCEIVQRGLEVVPILAQHPAYGKQLCRQRFREAGKHGFGIADVARIAAGHGQVEIVLGEPSGRPWVVLGGSHGRAQGEQFAGTGVAGTRRQAFEHFGIVTRLARRGVRGQRQTGRQRHQQQAQDSQVREAGQLEHSHSR
jgi:hypothetical protein